MNRNLTNKVDIAKWHYWKELRRGVGSAEEMLRFLARHCKRSLLGDYACLRPAP